MLGDVNSPCSIAMLWSLDLILYENITYSKESILNMQQLVGNSTTENNMVAIYKIKSD